MVAPAGPADDSGELRAQLKELRQRADEYRRTVDALQQALRAPMAPLDVADAVMATMTVAYIYDSA